MGFKTKKVLVMCCEGAYQDYLIHRLDDEFSVCGIVRQKSDQKRRSLLNRIRAHKHPLTFIGHLLTRLKLRKFERQAAPVIRELFNRNPGQTDFRRDTAQILCTDINHPDVVAFIKNQNPDLICVNGTNLLRRPILDLIEDFEFGIINLHTGLSPYSRGGNCNLYMLLEQRPELVGITVHHIDRGIDSGDIIISCRPELSPDDSYEIIDAKCFHMGIEAMVEACKQLFSGNSLRVRQWQKGKLFLNRTGYFYKPGHRLEVNRMLKNGLLADFLQSKGHADDGIRTIGKFHYRYD